MNKTLLFTVLFGISIFSLSGCTAKGPQFQSFQKPKNPNDGIIYVYRPFKFFGIAFKYDVFADRMYHHNEGYYIGKIKVNSYSYKEVPNGIYKVKATTSTLDKTFIKVKVGKNKIICIRTYPGMGVLVGRANFELVDMKTCKKEIKGTRLNLE
jgi:hypothetical protein